MKKHLMIIMALGTAFFGLKGADSIDEETIQWAQAPFSKCVTPQQKMKCTFAQYGCKLLDTATQAKIKQKREQNKLDEGYTLPLLAEEDTKITPGKTAVYLQLIKSKAVDIE